MIVPFIKPPVVCFSCYKVLPLVYDDALSYYEQICKLYKTLNETVEAVNTLNEALSKINDNYEPLARQVEALTNELTTFEAGVNQRVSAMEQQLADYDDRFNTLEEDMRKAIANSIITLKEYVDSQIGDIEALVEHILEQQIEQLYKDMERTKVELITEIEAQINALIKSIPDLTTINVINPVKGYMTNVQSALDDLFMNTRYNALTVDEFNHLKMDINTCNTLMEHSAPTGWSVITWLTKAKEWINKNPKHLMFNFINGAIVDFKKNIEQNNDMLRICGCLNCAEYNELELTINELIGYGATCEEVAWKSNRIFV